MQTGQNAYSQFLKGRGSCNSCCFLYQFVRVRIDSGFRSLRLPAAKNFEILLREIASPFSPWTYFVNNLVFGRVGVSSGQIQNGGFIQSKFEFGRTYVCLQNTNCGLFRNLIFLFHHIKSLTIGKYRLTHYKNYSTIELKSNSLNRMGGQNENHRNRF